MRPRRIGKAVILRIHLFVKKFQGNGEKTSRAQKAALTNERFSLKVDYCKINFFNNQMKY
jgi:hypothetical protein